MSVRIQVIGKDNRPIAGVEVFVSWQSGGHSSLRTDASGIADLGASAGTANYVQVNGRQVLGTIWLDDRIHTVSDR
jgi:hypothetical protein